MTGPTIAILGAGSWGTALAIRLARNGHRCTLWGHDPSHIARLRADRSNQQYLPGVSFPPQLNVCEDLKATVGDAGLVMLVLPSHAFRSCLQAAVPWLAPGVHIAWATKGLELTTGRLLDNVVSELLGSDTPAAVISGPTFAAEVAADLPTAVTVASRQARFAQELAALLHSEQFRAYTSNDVIGVQVGGATKNVLAIAAGVADGIGFGANARAALITRGLSEIMRLGLVMGARSETLMGLAGLGDLILTCTDNQSRNRRFGLGLGRGLRKADVAAEIGQEIEGIGTTRLVYQRSRDLGVDMPITEQVYRMLYEDLPAIDAVRNLLLRSQKAETIGR
jgi:glycerol-3-phosphate dehydrogenase (NAD(P)+)